VLRGGRRDDGTYSDAVEIHPHPSPLPSRGEHKVGRMANYLIMAAMKGRFMSEQGNLYDNFQMLGYVEGASPFDAVAAFFDQPKFPIVWADVEYMWAEKLADDPSTGHHGEYERVYIASLRERWEGSSRN